MIKNKRTFRKMKNESCDDPRELLLSLVDLGSIDTDEMLVACVSEMSDAECKRVLNSLSLPSNSEEVEDEWSDSEEVEDADVEPSDDLVLDDEEESSEEPDEESEDEDQIAEVESRIRRLERIAKRENKKPGLRNETYRKVKFPIKRARRKFESFESDNDEDGARAVANSMAEDFSQMIGAGLTPSDTTDIVDSPTYGWSNDVEMDDTDARYTFTYDVEGYPGVSVYFRPTDNTVCVWKSLTNGSNCEGAVDPKTGMCEWSDDLSECSYPLGAWRNFDLEMIHSDEEFESVKRPRKRVVRR